MAINFINQAPVKGIENLATATNVRPSRDELLSPEVVEMALREAGMTTGEQEQIAAAVEGTSKAKGMTTVRNPDGTDTITDYDDIVVEGSTKSGLTGPGVRDTRLRLSAFGNPDTTYGPNDPSNILAPLHATRGLMFPYTPTITVSGDANWTSHDLVHTNFDTLSYQRTPSATIGLVGKFTVQNQREGEYALAAIHFMRTVTKMYFGDLDSAQNNAAENAGKSAIAGLPPPVLLLNGYGTYMFKDIRVVVKGYSYTMDEGADLVTIISPAGGEVMLPPVFSLTVSLGLQQTPRRTRAEFKLDDFRTGSLLSSGGWF